MNVEEELELSSLEWLRAKLLLGDKFKAFWRYWKNSDEDHLYADLRADYASDHGGDNA